MSLHKSLVARNKLSRHRNVMTRVERLEKMEKLGVLDEEASVFGIPKTKVLAKLRKGKDKKEKEEEGDEAAEDGVEPAASK